MLEIGLMIVVVLFAAYQAYETRVERKYAVERERELLAAILSKDIGQYLQAVDALRKQPRDKLAEMKLENELAVAAAKLDGIPVS
jgi:hypothetical protein